MKELPPGFPPVTSAKWHSRRLWDPLGYLRVRTLANPNWDRDTRWLAQTLTRSTPANDAELRSLYGAAIDATKRFPRTTDGHIDDELAWDEVLTAVDAILTVTQRRHLGAVRATGRSGKDVPPEDL